MHALIRSTAAAGAPVLICSTDIDELATLCDRVVVLHQGAASAELAGDALTDARGARGDEHGDRRYGSNVASGATTTSSSSGVVAAGERRHELGRARSSSSSWRSIRRARSPARGPCAPMSIASNARPRAVAAAVALGEPVHDRVAAVDEHDEQHAGAVARRAPQRLDLVQRRAVADDRQHRAVRAAPSAGRSRAGQREAEHAHRAHEAERRGGGDAGVQLRAARRASPRRGSRRAAAASASAASTWPARSGSPASGGAGGAGVAAAATIRFAPRSTAPASAAQIAAGSPITASSTGLRCASSGSCGDARRRACPSRTSGPASYGYWRNAPRADDEHDVVRRERVAQPGAAGGQVPGEQRVVLREAGPGAERLLPDRGRRGARPARTSAAQPAAPSAPAPTTIAGRVGLRRAASASASTAAGVGGARSAAARCGPSVSCGSRRGREPVVHRHDHDRRARGRSPPRGRRARSRPARPAARAGWSNHTG